MFPSTLASWLSTYGYGAVWLFVLLESTGIPFPGETMLLIAAIAAGTTHQLAIPLVILAAASGAILGDNLGFWVGREGGFRLLRRYGRYIRLNERKLKVGLYLFRRHGGKVVFFGRFVTVLRMWAAVLAGIFHVRWSRFLLFNALGAVVWATGYGLGGYVLGTVVYRLAGPLGWGLLGLTGCLMLVFMLLLRRQEQQWEEQAARLFPGPLQHYLGSGMSHRTKQGGRPTTMWQHAQGEVTSLSHLFVQGTAKSTHDAVVAPHTAPQQGAVPDAGLARKPLRAIHLERFSS